MGEMITEKKTNEIYLIDHNKLEVSNASVIYAQYFDTLYRISDRTISDDLAVDSQRVSQPTASRQPYI